MQAVQLGPMPTRTHYELLGVGNSASANDIAKAYRRLALQLHPDKNPNSRGIAEQSFQQLTEAYQTLKDADSRRRYDLTFPGAQLSNHVQSPEPRDAVSAQGMGPQPCQSFPGGRTHVKSNAPGLSFSMPFSAPTSFPPADCGATPATVFAQRSQGFETRSDIGNVEGFVRTTNLQSVAADVEKFNGQWLTFPEGVIMVIEEGRVMSLGVNETFHANGSHCWVYLKGCLFQGTLCPEGQIVSWRDGRSSQWYRY